LAAEAAITPHTRAIVPVHIAGCPPDMDGILAVARRHGLRVVEDAAQAHGAEWRGRRVGALGDLGTFSFQASKNLNSGEGGAIVTDDETLYRRVWSLHNVGRALTEHWRTSGWYQHDLLGFNYRLTAFQAALLMAQMSRLEGQMARREQAAQLLDRELATIPGIRPQARDPRVSRPRAPPVRAALRGGGVRRSPSRTVPEGAACRRHPVQPRLYRAVAPQPGHRRRDPGAVFPSGPAG